MTLWTLACIVEGHGDVAAVPLLLRRLYTDVDLPTPIRVKRQRVIQPGELERYARIAEATILDRGRRGGILVLLDADDECAATLGPDILARLNRALPNRPAACTLAVREFESWLVAGDPDSDTDSDELRPTKRWLEAKRGRYVETVDQPKLAASMLIDRAETASRSFRHLVSALNALRHAVLSSSTEPD